jgi:hypothetical protein
VTSSWRRAAIGAGFLWAAIAAPAPAAAQTPVAGHYPPGQSGIRGAASPDPGWSITNFNRFFTNLEAKDASGNSTRSLEELRFANITMFTWVTRWKVLGLQYGALAGVPFATGNLNPSADEVGSTSFGLGDVLVTPVSLYGRQPTFDYQFQFTWWTSSGRFSPGSPDNRGAGFQALVYSLGGAWYQGGNRADWSASAVARLEQNFEQARTGIHPGNDVVIDWGVGKVVPAKRPLELGVSGFATWQLSEQTGGGAGTDTSPYRYLGLGPEASWSPWDRWTFRIRAHWEFLTRNAVQGNNLWLILNYAR